MGTKTTKQFIEESIQVHGYKYNYNNTIYFNNKTPLEILCSEHGIFKQTPIHHLKGSGCPECAGNKRGFGKDFIMKSKKIHGDLYDYSNTIYFNSKTPLEIKCQKHGIFKQIPSHHLNGSGCPECAGNKNSKTSFIDKSIKKHGKYYDYSKVNYINNKSKVIIICPIHNEFEQLPKYHLKGSGCPICKESKGEREISHLLTENNIKYIPQYKFDGCVDKRKLPFDFYLPDYNTCIEYDGEQHFKSKTVFGGDEAFNDRVNKDKIKNAFCENNNINLIRINYKENIKNELKIKIDMEKKEKG